MKKMELWSKITTGLLLLLCCIADVEGRMTKVDWANGEGILLVGIGPDPEGLDPHLVVGTTEQNVLRALFEGLVRPDPKTLEPLPGVAERWNVSVDGRTYTFFLREGAKWSNGDPLTAEDFVFSFRRGLDKTLGTSAAEYLFALKNARSFYNGTVPFEQVGVRALDRTRLELTLETPKPYFLSLLMMPAYYPVHAKTLEKWDGVRSRSNAWTKPGNLVSNGPFCLKSYVIGKEIEGVRNPHYWAPIALNGIRFYPVADVATEERSFRNGRLHITECVPYAKLTVYANKEVSELRLSPYLSTSYYLLNIHLKPLDDLRVRKALSLAIHRESLAGSDRMNVKHQSAVHLIPEGCGGFCSVAKVEEDPVRAQKLLAEAGFPGGKGFPKLKLFFNPSESQNYLAVAVQEMWKKNLGIEVELVNQEWKVYLSTRRNREFQIARGGWVGDYNDPETFLNLWESTSCNNFVGWSNAKFDQLLKESAETLDPAKRLLLLQEAEAILLDDMPL
ncbi:MAG: peptide ABC transporter substrate-binding protein, partial [Puniceicoccales bacterium]|nr:peptide ABC transporter substrate-binding protein [Puniceicoccales bacterium]